MQCDRLGERYSTAARGNSCLAALNILKIILFRHANAACLRLRQQGDFRHIDFAERFWQARALAKMELDDPTFDRKRFIVQQLNTPS